MISVTTGPPVFEIKPKNEIVNEGNNVTFHCNATSNPSPTLSWTKDGNAINQSSNNIVLSQDSQILNVINVERNDAGIYVCNATNNVNSVSASAYLNVQCKYKIVLKQFHFDFIHRPRECGTQSRTQALDVGPCYKPYNQLYCQLSFLDPVFSEHLFFNQRVICHVASYETPCFCPDITDSIANVDTALLSKPSPNSFPKYRQACN